MLRPVAVIVAAILMSRPELPREDATRWAEVLRDEARARDFDPLTVVSLVHHESGWHPTRISPSGEDFGLGQIRARYLEPCRKDEDPVRRPSEACKRLQETLLEPEANLRTIARLVLLHRGICRKKAGSAAVDRWLASYQGRNYPRKKRWCVPGERTRKILEYRAKLIREAPRAAARAAGEDR